MQRVRSLLLLSLLLGGGFLVLLPGAVSGIVGTGEAGAEAVATGKTTPGEPATAGLSAAPPPVTPSAAPVPAGYVPDAECAKCHRELAESFRGVGMARSFGRAGDPGVDGARRVEDLPSEPFFHAPSQRWYQVVERDGRPVFRRWQVDREGRPINLFERPVDWVLGSGHRARSYLYANPGGELVLFPVEWYARTEHQEGGWGMAPGFDREDHLGVLRPVQRECMFCHNAYPGWAPGEDLHGMPDRFPAELPSGIGCQRCHGPGARHVELAAGGLGTMEAIRSSVVNPSRLAPELRDDVCWQCHMQPSVALPGLRRMGRGDTEFRPGQPLPEFQVHFDVLETRRARGDRFEINHHPYRLTQSLCWTQSERRLSCMTCHDPHRKVPPEERVAHYRAACLSCHGEQACSREHGPATAAGEGAGDTSHGPAGDAAGASYGDGARRSARPDPGTSGTGRLAEAQSGAGSARSGDPNPEAQQVPNRLLRAAAENDCVACHMPPRRTQDVVHAVMTDHRIQRRPPPEAERLAPLEELDPVLEDVFPLHPERAPEGDLLQLYRALVVVRMAGGASPDALEHLEKRVARLRPEAPDAFLDLANGWIQRRDLDRAERALRSALERAPDHPQALALMGVVRMARGETQEGASWLQRAAEAGAAPEVHYNLSRAHLDLGRPEAARQELERAVALRPTFTTAWHALGRLREQLDGREGEGGAEAAYRKALAISPEHGPSYLALGRLLLARGDRAEALRWLSHGAEVARPPEPVAEALEQARNAVPP